MVMCGLGWAIYFISLLCPVHTQSETCIFLPSIEGERGETVLCALPRSKTAEIKRGGGDERCSTEEKCKMRAQRILMGNSAFPSLLCFFLLSDICFCCLEIYFRLLFGKSIRSVLLFNTFPIFFPFSFLGRSSFETHLNK